jgi:hypothetical protein
MEQIILVLTVEPQTKGKKSWVKIGYKDNDKDFTTHIFPHVPGYNLIAKGKMLKLTKNKNEESGYWEVEKIEAAGTPAATTELSTPSMDKALNAQKPIQIDPEKAVQPKVGTGDSRERSMCLSYAKDLVVAGKVEVKNIGKCADYLLGWLDGTVKTNGLVDTSWMIK